MTVKEVGRTQMNQFQQDGKLEPVYAFLFSTLYSCQLIHPLTPAAFYCYLYPTSPPLAIGFQLLEFTLP